MLCVLYVEDHPSNARLVQRLVERRDTVSLNVATTGREGVAMAGRLHPDLVLLDLHLPDISGEVVLERIWALPGLARTPVVVLTADATEATARRLHELGVTDHLTKPLDVRAFYDQLDRAEARLALRNGAQAC